jgi:BlaI family transcriptional regulator, penicillinase repressor
MAREPKAKSKSIRPPKPLTDVEWAIMGAVWQHQPCTAGTVQEALDAAHGWAYSTVKTTMDRMVAKGLLSTHAVRNLQMFVPLVSRTEAKRAELRRLLSRAFNGALTPMIKFLVEDEGLSAEELKQLRKLLDGAKGKMK